VLKGPSDVTNSDLITLSNGDITLDPDGTGSVLVDGDLDVTSPFEIISTLGSDADVIIDPDGKGNVVAKGDTLEVGWSGGDGEIVLYDNDAGGDQTVAIKPHEAAFAESTGGMSNWTLTLPVNDGDANQVLHTDGDGFTSWDDGTAGVLDSLSAPDGYSFINEVVTPLGAMGGSEVIAAMDAADTFHVFYASADTVPDGGDGHGELAYVFRDPGTGVWSDPVVADLGFELSATDFYFSLSSGGYADVTSDNEPHVVYQNVFEGNSLRHTYRSGGSWTTEDTGIGNSATGDDYGGTWDKRGRFTISQDTMYVVYNNISLDDVTLGKGVTGSWSELVVDNTGIVDPKAPSLHFDDAGNLHVAFIQDSSGQAQLVHYVSANRGDSWSTPDTITTFDAPISNEGSFTIATSELNDVFITGHTPTRDSLFVAMKLDTATVWDIENIDLVMDDAHQHPNHIVRGPNGDIWVAYRIDTNVTGSNNNKNKFLNLARRLGDEYDFGWNDGGLDGTFVIGEEITFDSTGLDTAYAVLNAATGATVGTMNITLRKGPVPGNDWTITGATQTGSVNGALTINDDETDNWEIYARIDDHFNSGANPQMFWDSLDYWHIFHFENETNNAYPEFGFDGRDVVIHTTNRDSDYRAGLIYFDNDQKRPVVFDGVNSDTLQTSDKDYDFMVTFGGDGGAVIDSSSKRYLGYAMEPQRKIITFPLGMDSVAAALPSGSGRAPDFYVAGYFESSDIWSNMSGNKDMGFLARIYHGTPFVVLGQVTSNTCSVEVATIRWDPDTGDSTIDSDTLTFLNGATIDSTVIGTKEFAGQIRFSFLGGQTRNANVGVVNPWQNYGRPFRVKSMTAMWDAEDDDPLIDLEIQKWDPAVDLDYHATNGATLQNRQWRTRDSPGFGVTNDQNDAGARHFVEIRNLDIDVDPRVGEGIIIRFTGVTTDETPFKSGYVHLEIEEGSSPASIVPFTVPWDSEIVSVIATSLDSSDSWQAELYKAPDLAAIPDEGDQLINSQVDSTYKVDLDGGTTYMLSRTEHARYNAINGIYRIPIEFVEGDVVKGYCRVTGDNRATAPTINVYFRRK
jgi:hypothetical protein